MIRINIHKMCILFALLLTSTSISAQSVKIDVEVHIGDKDAYIYVDGNKTAIGHGRTLYNIQLTEGKHTITATRPSYTTVSKTVSISSKNYASRIIQLTTPKPIYGSIEVTSSPTYLEIELDGMMTGKFTPYVFDSILIGSHKIVLKEVRYNDKSEEFTVIESDTTHLNMVLVKKEEKKQTQASTYTSTSYTTGYSSYSSHSNKNNDNYSTYYSKHQEKEEVKYNWRVLYFGIGGAVGTNFSAQLSFFNIRYNFIEIRPCVWGVSGSILKNLPHHKLPNTLVHPKESHDAYSYADYYDYAEPKRGAQWYYAPTLRFHIPVRKNYNTSFIFGIGPQISWTKIKWNEKNGLLPSFDSYEFTNEPFPRDSYVSDGVWFTAEMAINWQFSNHTDFEMFLRYQDGFVFGAEIKFGKSY